MRSICQSYEKAVNKIGIDHYYTPGMSLLTYLGQYD